MKKLILSFLFTILLLLVGAQPIMSCKDVNDMYDNRVNNTLMDQYGYSRIFDCDRYTTIETNNCSIEIYMKLNPGNIDFFVKSYDARDFKLFLYDMFGRKLLEENLKCESTFNKDKLSNGLYLIKITNGTEVYTRRITL